jgi:hypothetical protein
MGNRVATTVLVAVLTLSGVRANAARQAGDELDKLAWLAGCWTGGDDVRQVDEQWMKPLGGTMMGMGRTVANGKTVDWETLVIRHAGSEIVFVANPARQAEASFTMVSASENEVRFENPSHDFPQRIIYRLNPDGSLHARIEGTRDGKLRGVDFPMKRGKC